MPDLLLEVLSEEIPARMQAGGTQELEKQVCSRLEKARLTFKKPETFATPRRLALIVPGLPPVQPDITVERKGPRVDAPEKAIQGFLKSTGLTLEECEQRETPKGPVWFAVKREKGRPTSDLLTDLLPAGTRRRLLAQVHALGGEWYALGAPDPLHPLPAGRCDVIPFRFGAVDSGRTTLGHRFLSSGPLTVDDVGSYAPSLEAAKVMLDPARRAKKIEDDARALVEQEGLSVAPDKWLVTENAGLVEWPVVLMGSIDDLFKQLPDPVLRSAMRTHQRYFGVLEENAWLAPRFVMVSNAKTDDGSVVAGNERVLRARLADARFFWSQDTSQWLEKYLPALKGVVFHARLGNMYEKARRIEKLACELCPAIEGADPNHAARAGLLCKADLVTELVGEFPDLQGLMGSLYAEQQKEPERPEVCEAIRETLRSARAERRVPHGAGECRGGARGQARHAGRLLRHRRAADRLQGPLRAPPRRPRRDPSHLRESSYGSP